MNLNVKIFKINKNHIELTSKNFEESVNKIIYNSRYKLGIDNPQDDIIFSHKEYLNNEFQLATFQFSHEETDNKWRMFLSNNVEISEEMKVIDLSLVQFIKFKNNIYCFVGGRGMQIIRKYIDERFGIELYEKFCNLDKDILLSIKNRNIFGNVTETKEVYRNNRIIRENLNLQDLPTELTVKITREYFDSIFPFISYSNDVNLSVSSYFAINKKISFENILDLAMTFDSLLSKESLSRLSYFKRIKDAYFIQNDITNQLLSDIRDEIMNLYSSTRNVDYSENRNIDFIHHNIETFVKSNEFHIVIKGKPNEPTILKTYHHLYTTCLKICYDKLGDNFSVYDLNEFLKKIRILSYIDKGNSVSKEKTQAYFFNHLTCEIKIGNSSYFKIGNDWFQIENNLLEYINQECKQIYQANSLEKNILMFKWEKTYNSKGELKLIEDHYNKLYDNQDNYIVLDKNLPDNIELCDILHYTEDSIYLIHVKNGFDISMRDLSYQLLVSKDRLQYDLKNSEENTYLKKVFSKLVNPKLSEIEFCELFNKKIYNVMAFKSNYQDFSNDLDKSKSNVAKFCLRNTYKEYKNSDQKILFFDINSIQTSSS